jgi:hypothetical protein
MANGFIPKHGGYKKLLSYQKALIVYQGTRYYVKRWVPRGSRDRDQMEQAARSGKQNIVEGSAAPVPVVPEVPVVPSSWNFVRKGQNDRRRAIDAAHGLLLRNPSDARSDGRALGGGGIVLPAPVVAGVPNLAKPNEQSLVTRRAPLVDLQLGHPACRHLFH